MKRRGRPPDEDSFTAFAIDQLRGLGVVEARAMFGGKGLYWKDQIFGLIDEGGVYFRASDATVGRYQSMGSEPFEPWPGHVMTDYYEVPANVLEDADEAAAWAREAWLLPRAKGRKSTARRSDRGQVRKRSARRG